MKPFKVFLSVFFVIVVSQTTLLRAQQQDNSIYAASYAPDGSLVAIVGEMQDFSGLFIFDVAGGEQAHLELRGANGVAWGPDGRIAVRWLPEGDFAYMISIFDAQTREETVRLEARYPVDAPEFLWSPDGHMLLHYGQATYTVWDTIDGRLLSENVLGFTGRDDIQDAFWHPLTQEIYILDSSNHIFVFNPTTGERIREPFVLEIQPGGAEGYYLYASQMEIHPDGSLIAVAFNDRRQTMQIINTDTGETIQLFNATDPDYDIRGLRWTTDGQAIATLGRSISFWNVERGELLESLTDVDITFLRAFTFRPDGRQIVVVGTDASTTLGMDPSDEIPRAATIVLAPATAVLIDLDQIPIFMREMN